MARYSIPRSKMKEQAQQAVQHYNTRAERDEKNYHQFPHPLMAARTKIIRPLSKAPQSKRITPRIYGENNSKLDRVDWEKQIQSVARKNLKHADHLRRAFLARNPTLQFDIARILREGE